MAKKKNSNFSISGKKILLIGATGVLGKTYAKVFSQEKTKLVIADNNPKELKKLSSDLKCNYVEIDVKSEKSVNMAINSSKKMLNGFDSVIYNVATTSEQLKKEGDVFEDFEKYPTHLWKQIIDVNLTGCFLVARQAGSIMKKQGFGNFIIVSSIYGVVGPDHSIYENQEFSSFAGYSASKAGLIGLTKWLATWWAENGIRVNSLTPGGVFNNHNETFVEKYSSRTPMKRMANRSELEGIMCFLISDASSYCTGQNFIVDGGYTAW